MVDTGGRQGDAVSVCPVVGSADTTWPVDAGTTDCLVVFYLYTAV